MSWEQGFDGLLLSWRQLPANSTTRVPSARMSSDLELYAVLGEQCFQRRQTTTGERYVPGKVLRTVDHPGRERRRQPHGSAS